MMFWMQSMFFRLLGDHWWVEKLYTLIVLVINCLLIARVWSILWRNPDGAASSYSWLPVWLFYFIPIVVWGSPQNLIDSQLLMFCLLALWCLLKMVTAQKNMVVLFALAVLFIFCGILTKGPVALYPVCVPALYGLIVDKNFWKKGFLLSATLLVVTLSLFVAMVMVHEPALHFFTQYWVQRLSVAIEGGRADGLRTGWARLYIFWLLLRENSMILPISMVLFFIAWRKGLVTRTYIYERRVALFFLVLALCATVPVMASTRQAGMYLIPGLVLFAMAAGFFHAPLFIYWFSKLKPMTNRLISTIALLGILLVMVYSVMLIGKPGREKALLHDLPQLQRIIPEGAQVGTCDDVMSNFVYHVYLQRFHKIQLVNDATQPKYFISKGGCQEAELMQLKANHFRQLFKGEQVELFVKR